jgi:tetratricopeptide (TPR) repeat protein
VLKAQPDNLEALRGVGDIDYDRQDYDRAIAAYEHFLKRKPDDPQVRTDLGTMYLYTGNADQAIVQYKKAIATKPDFFQGYFNMGVALAQQNKLDDAGAALNKALSLAPDDSARNQVKDLIAKLSGNAPASSPTSTPTPAASASVTTASKGVESTSPSQTATLTPAVVVAPPNTFHGAVESYVRNMPIAGPKVGAVQWPADLKGRVMFEEFPMDQMPPFAKQKFFADLKTGIDAAKKNYKISQPVKLDLVDGLSGRLMDSITQ